MWKYKSKLTEFKADNEQHPILKANKVSMYHEEKLGRDVKNEL